MAEMLIHLDPSMQSVQIEKPEKFLDHGGFYVMKIHLTEKLGTSTITIFADNLKQFSPIHQGDSTNV